MKFLLVLLVVGIGVWMLSAKLRAWRRSDDAPARPPAATPVVEVVQCAHCGLHLPAADALPEGSRLYCSETHRRLGPVDMPPPG